MSMCWYLKSATRRREKCTDHTKNKLFFLPIKSLNLLRTIMSRRGRYLLFIIIERLLSWIPRVHKKVKPENYLYKRNLSWNQRGEKFYVADKVSSVSREEKKKNIFERRKERKEKKYLKWKRQNDLEAIVVCCESKDEGISLSFHYVLCYVTHLRSLSRAHKHSPA